MRAALSDLKLDGLDVVHAGDGTFPLTNRIRAVALSDLLDILHPLRAWVLPSARVSSWGCTTCEFLVQPL